MSDHRCEVLLRESLNSVFKRPFFFSICDFVRVAEGAGVSHRDLLNDKRFNAVRAMHCIHWNDMSSNAKAALRSLCEELVGLLDEPEAVAPAPVAPSRILDRLRAFFHA